LNLRRKSKKFFAYEIGPAHGKIFEIQFREPFHFREQSLFFDCGSLMNAKIKRLNKHVEPSLDGLF
jgi:hypothetical protein